MEYKCESVAQSIGFLHRFVERLRLSPMWIFFMSRKHISKVEY